MPILGAPYTPPPPPRPLVSHAGFRQTWHGWDGTDWVLTGRQSGIRLGQGVRGLHFPNVDRYSSDSPAVAGSLYRGSRTRDREVVWPVRVFVNGSSTDWTAYDSAFWRTMDPTHTGTWTVTSPDGESRTLELRPVHDGGHAFDVDPSMLGWTSYSQSFLAEQPYWQGPTVSRTFDSGGGGPFHSAPGDAFVIRISPASTLATASITNPGDVASFPRYKLTGPITSAVVGVGGKLTEYLVSIPAGQTRTIDTRPDRQTVVDQNGADKIADLGQVAFNAPIPPGAEVGLSLTIVGTGSVTVELDPLYWRAW